jgi:hypothetical protein
VGLLREGTSKSGRGEERVMGVDMMKVYYVYVCVHTCVKTEKSQKLKKERRRNAG